MKLTESQRTKEDMKAELEKLSDRQKQAICDWLLCRYGHGDVAEALGLKRLVIKAVYLEACDRQPKLMHNQLINMKYFESLKKS